MIKQTKISFTEYRDLLTSYERLVNVDYHSCVGSRERNWWKERAVKHFTKLDGVTCCKAELVQRYESTVDRAVKLIEGIK